ncbi:hypothetical protein H206_01086 [Candidatus Electrothrix aarhusensis]|uniref:Uncharacterized protein n=1 Tax=Candidatus Electrothrix aarhusensis TaxID=1859131 RepID=A0A3S3QPN0_9BACT|nr:hypothetical protein H206_01086 [Candidatus Electrothrix aarhusensis]
MKARTMTAVKAPAGVSLSMPEPPLPDIGLNDRIIKEWGKDITQQDGQHHSFRVSRVDHPDQDGQGPDKKAVAPSTDIGMRGRDWVGGHEDEAEGETA